MNTVQSPSLPSPEQVSSNLLRFAMPMIGACAVILAIALTPAMFTGGSVRNMLVQLSPLAIVALGQMLVILVRGLDLSVASVMATTAVISASFGSSTSGFFLVVVVATLTSSLVGLVNGLLITKRKLEPFLCTLATMIVLQGIRSAITKGAPLGDTPAAVRFIGRANLVGIPVGTIVLVVVVLAVAFVLKRTAAGRRVYLVGSNEQAAKLSGVSTGRVKIACYIACSCFAGLGGVVLAGYLDQVDNWVGKGFELDSVVAAVLGGVALTGGVGGAFGTMCGAAVLILMSNFILQLGIPIEFQLIMKGAVVILAVAIYTRRSLAR